MMTEHPFLVESASEPEVQSIPLAISAVEAERLLTSDAAAAASRARTYLAKQPGNGGARLLLGAALRRQGDFAGAKAVLEPLTQSQPDLILAHHELGLALGGLGAHSEAISALSRAVDLMPNFAAGWFALAERLDRVRGQDSLREARAAANRGQLHLAESLLRDATAGGEDDAGNLLLSIVLLAQEKGHEALPLLKGLLIQHPGDRVYRDLLAAALFQAEEFEAAIAQYEEILKHSPERPGAWMSYGRALRALGRQERCIAAFKRAIELLPGWIEAYRTLASVRTYRFESSEVDTLRTLLARSDLPAANYAELRYALAKAVEESGDYAGAFEHFKESNTIQRANNPYSAEASRSFIRREMALYTPDFIRERTGAGSHDRGPIFVVGMPRAGSTLVQEILCAHSAIERTGELRDLTWMTARLDQESVAAGTGTRYPEVLRTFERDRFRLLGAEYLQSTRQRRKLSRPFFVDKYPGNFYRTGLIHLILPNAKIVDVRRHPLDSCLSCFKHYFPEGQAFTNSLTDLGRYYADYVELMARFDSVLPGKVHRLCYEDLVKYPEQEVRRLFEYLELPFEEQCLRFYEREQVVMTSSAEQVRVAINDRGVGIWRNYEKWLGPLRSALGPVLDAYPSVPKFQVTPTFHFASVSMTMRLG